MSDKLYRKVGRRYEPVGYEFVGFPAPGVWLVTKGEHFRSERLITNLGDAVPVMTLAAFERHRDVISRAVSKELSSGLWSPDGVAGAAIRAVLEAEQKERP